MTRPEITREMVAEALFEKKLHPSVPEVVVAIITITSSPSSSISDLVEVIERDKELSESILRIANSGVYRYKRRIESIADAVVLLGWNAVKMAAFGSTILARMRDRDHRLYDHSMHTARIARFLAMEADFYKVEEIAVAGLLHDLGFMVLETYFTELFLKVKQYSLDRHVPIHIAERDLLGIDHGTIGGWTLEEWRLPENIVESVACHHDFDRTRYHARKTAVIHVADVLAVATDYAGPHWEKVPQLATEALETLGFSETELRDMLLTIIRQKNEPLFI